MLIGFNSQIKPKINFWLKITSVFDSFYLKTLVNTGCPVTRTIVSYLGTTVSYSGTTVFVATPSIDCIAFNLVSYL